MVNSAGKNGKYVIGVDSDQNWLDENVVIASAVKNVDVAVYDIMKKLKDNTMKSKVYVYGLEEGGVGLIIGKESNIGIENIKKIKEIESKNIK